MTAEAKRMQLKATFVGFTAVLMWSALALLTKLSGPLSMAFSIAFLIGLALWWRKGGLVLHYLKLPLLVWFVGIGGLFGNKIFYFVVLDNAPPVEASLIVYLWPLLIVLLSTLLPTETLSWFHLLGALCGVIGAGLLAQG